MATLVQVLANNNIAINEAIIESSKDSLPGIEAFNRINNKDIIASDFLGKSYQDAGDGVYKNETATLKLTSLSADLTVTSPKDKKYNDLNKLNAGHKIINTLSKYNFEKDTLNVYSVDENSNGNFYASISYSYDSTPVFNHNLTAVADKNGLKSLKGSVMSFVEIKNQEYSIISTADVLLEFIKNKDVTDSKEKTVITGVRLGYYLPTEEFEVSIYAIPAYEIKLENGKLYYYDARTNVDAAFKLLGSKTGTK